MRVLGPSGTALTGWSFGGPWVGLAWPALAKRLRKANALHADGFRAGPGFYAIAEKSGIRRRRHARANGSVPPEPAGTRRGTAGPPERTAARRGNGGTRPATPARGAPPKGPARAVQTPSADMPSLAKRPTPKTAKPPKPVKSVKSVKSVKAAKPAARRSSAKPPSSSPPSASGSRASRRPAARPGTAETPPGTPS